MEELDCFALKTKEVKIGKSTFKVKELSYGERNEVRKATMQYDTETGKTKVDIYGASELKLLKGLVAAPFEVNPDNIKKLKDNIADKLLEEINSMYGLNEEEVKK